MESESISLIMAHLAFQLGFIFFVVRVFGNLVSKVGIPQVLGELLAGLIIGPYALGAIAIPGFPHGIFPLGTGPWEAVSAGLKWPLEGLPWNRGFTGLSNRTETGKWSIEIKSGRFLAVLPQMQHAVF